MDVGDALLHIGCTLIAMTVQGIHHPMKQGLVFTRDGYATIAEDRRVIHTMIVVEADVFVRKEAIHAMAKDEVFRYTALQALSFGEEPKLIGQHQSLLDVVRGE